MVKKNVMKLIENTVLSEVLQKRSALPEFKRFAYRRKRKVKLESNVRNRNSQYEVL